MSDDNRRNLNQPIFDYEDFIERIDGDIELLKEVLEIFLEDTPGLFSDLNQGIKNNDVKAIERAAHTLKGAAANISAKRLQALSHRLLMQTRKGDMALAGHVFDDMVKNYDELEKLLTSHLSS